MAEALGTYDLPSMTSMQPYSLQEEKDFEKTSSHITDIEKLRALSIQGSIRTKTDHTSVVLDQS
jgi:hypothetical protein